MAEWVSDSKAKPKTSHLGPRLRAKPTVSEPGPPSVPFVATSRAGSFQLLYHPAPSVAHHIKPQMQAANNNRPDPVLTLPAFPKCREEEYRCDQRQHREVSVYTIRQDSERRRLRTWVYFEDSARDIM